ncbi:MAG: PIN domain-containing protein, partial [Dolichospermum sp.]|nr:PIN domain-containing protein [Dolichospermum sp.]
MICKLLKESKILKLKEKVYLLAALPILKCEMRRGFLAVDAPKQRERFNKFCQNYPIIFLDDLAILEKAAEIHANLRLKGLPIQTEDVLIAATAMIKGLTVVSNDSDLTRVEGLSL